MVRETFLNTVEKDNPTKNLRQNNNNNKNLTQNQRK